MDWQHQLISVYVNVCSSWQKGLYAAVQRISNNNRFKFTDQEVATLYIFGVVSGLTNVRAIYDYAHRHLREWFPTLGTYQAFSYRLNRISASFSLLCEHLVLNEEFSSSDCPRDWVVDSLPIVMAGPRTSGRAKVAAELASKGYCASKKLYFYGVKLHCVGLLKPNTIPAPSFVGLAPANVHDHTVFEQISSTLTIGRIFADKAYGDSDHQKRLFEKQGIHLLTPLKKEKGLFSMPGPETFSTCVSRVRQPIESFFNWLHVKTGIQSASKVRSADGLLVHTFGKLAAAIMLKTLL
jgi:hypothetical protein